MTNNDDTTQITITLSGDKVLKWDGSVPNIVTIGDYFEDDSHHDHDVDLDTLVQTLEILKAMIPMTVKRNSD